MKKLFIVLAVVSLGFVACNNSGDSKDGADTTTTPEVVPATPDTTAVTMPDTTAATPDTTAAAK